MQMSLFCPRLFDGLSMHHDVLLETGGGLVQGIVGAGAAGEALSLPPDCTVAPGLVDIQVNGGGGVLFNDTPTARGLARLAHAHAMQGTTALLPTLISDTRSRVAQAVEAVRLAHGSVPGVLGIHLEGPFLRPERRGIHSLDRIASFDGASDLALLSALGGAGKTLVTLAPECVPQGTVRALRALGVLVFAGHTDASFEQTQSAVAEGLDGFTHMFNAMSQFSARAPGSVGAALLAPGCYAGLVLDGHHVATGSVAVLRAARGLERVVLVSDAMPPAGTADTAFMLQGVPIQVEAGRCVGPGGTLAGAAITLADAVRIATLQYGFALESALACAARVPAQLLGLADEYGVLRVGARADAVVFDGALRVCGVMQGGQWIRPLEVLP